MPRVSKRNYYLDIAETVLERATCLRRIYGAIIVKHDEIISTGYNGAPRGRANCVDMGYCSREMMRVPRGERYELCRSVHAEANAIISASRRDMVGGTLYLVGRNAQTGELLHDATSCAMCRRMIINAGLARVVIRNTPTEFEVVDVQEWIDSDDTMLPEGNCSCGCGK
jgi:dCMP deaminase